VEVKMVRAGEKKVSNATGRNPTCPSAAIIYTGEATLRGCQEDKSSGVRGNKADRAKKAIGRLGTVLIGWVILIGCEASLTRPGEVPDWIREEWKIGQDLLVERAGSGVYNVHPEHFSFVEHDGIVDCDYPNGCNGKFVHGFGHTPTIHYNKLTPTVIHHEAMHAILWKLGHPDFECIEHTC
jgi:hypothetical protein